MSVDLLLMYTQTLIRVLATNKRQLYRNRYEGLSVALCTKQRYVTNSSSNHVGSIRGLVNCILYQSIKHIDAKIPHISPSYMNATMSILLKILSATQESKIVHFN